MDHLTASLCIVVLLHIKLHESYHLIGCEDIEKPVTSKQQKLIVRSYRRDLHRQCMCVGE